MANPVKISNNLTNFLAENKKEEELMYEVLLMIENLAYREEATVKLIFDRLYDIGSINLINQKFRSRAVKRVLKWIARMSKPAFRIFAWRWFRKNCPILITNWLYQQVSFKKPVIKSAQVVIEQQLPPANAISELEYKSREVTFLRSQVKLLSGILIGVITVFGASLIWLSQSLITGRSPLQTVEQLPPVNLQEAMINRR
ncbi:MAG: hypothetical protein IGS49_23070 [Chlorogloeopsis fritschii C42_A2020_084]|uniref:hypothetical protein n=1 Tax=Chlorogloeopsis fritschii TaxID=1124 RepID=UPI0019EF593C|nr:hypothetical protein [Chlorogloeopsis fritschii]MBF2008245.1 hypothetical protein [Chlorogloeopsis fritschii C42_A2020_084]